MKEDRDVSHPRGQWVSFYLSESPTLGYQRKTTSTEYKVLGKTRDVSKLETETYETPVKETVEFTDTPNTLENINPRGSTPQDIKEVRGERNRDKSWLSTRNTIL